MKILVNPVFSWETCSLESCEREYEYTGPVVELKKGGKAPAAPDPNVVSAAQTKSNKETAAYNAAVNRNNTYTPLGSQTYKFKGYDPATGAPMYDETVSLSPDAQAQFDQEMQQNRQLNNVAGGMLGQIGQTYAKPMDTSGLPQLQGSLDTSGLPQLYGAGDLEGARTQTQDALYQRQAQYLDPEWQRRQEGELTRLANMGVTEGSAAWEDAIARMGRERQGAYADARMAAIGAGGDEMSRLSGIASQNRGQMYGELLGGAQFGNQARSQGLEELYALRNQPLNEFNALRSASPVAMPNFQSAPDVAMQGTDVGGNIWNSYNANLNNYNAQQASKNGMLGGLMQLGGSLGSAWLLSDERAKENVEAVGTLPDGVGVYEYNYKGESPADRQTGVMAQDVERVHPDAVATAADGYKRVNYARVLAHALAGAR